MSLAADAKNEMNKMSEGQQEKSGDMKHFDEAAANDRVNKLWAEVTAKKAAEAQKAAEIAAIPVSEQDVILISSTLNISVTEAKLSLQRKKGDVVAVLREASDGFRQTCPSYTVLKLFYVAFFGPLSVSPRNHLGMVTTMPPPGGRGNYYKTKKEKIIKKIKLLLSNWFGNGHFWGAAHLCLRLSSCIFPGLWAGGGALKRRLSAPSVTSREGLPNRPLPGFYVERSRGPHPG
eukprot:gene8935-6268_t